MRIAIGIAALLVSCVAHAAKLPPPMRFNLVQASCNAVPPAVPGPCSAIFRFTSGTVVMKSLRQPQPTCPKTGKPTEAPGGTIQMKKVTKNGSAFTGSLDAQVFFKSTFGSDPNGNCEFRELHVPNLLSLLGTLNCTNGTCKGVVYPIQCVPPQCADTSVVSELGSAELNGQSFGPILVLDDAGVPFATPGTALLPGKEP